MGGRLRSPALYPTAGGVIYSIVLRIDPMEQQLKLTGEETSFLQWLRENGGAGVRCESSLIGSADRLIKAGYVKQRADSFSLDIIHYTLTQSGADALLALKRS